MDAMDDFLVTVGTECTVMLVSGDVSKGYIVEPSFVAVSYAISRVSTGVGGRFVNL